MEKVGMLFGCLENMYVLRPFGTFNGNLIVYLKFGIFPPVLVYCVKKNLATLSRTCIL
jgi:hypothetical protein